MQNDKTLEQLIKEHEANMPPEIMGLINSFDWRKEVRAIVNQNQLMIDVGSDLEQSIYLMILGVINGEDLYGRLMDTHEIPEDRVKKIMTEVDVQIFQPLHRKLMEMDGEEETAPKSVEEERNDTIAEIEKEPEAVIRKPLNFNVPGDKAEEKKEEKPFVVSDSKEVEVQEPALDAGKIVTGVQEDPVSSAIQNPVVVKQEPTKAAPQKPVVDPYREPIE